MDLKMKTCMNCGKPYLAKSYLIDLDWPICSNCDFDRNEQKRHDELMEFEREKERRRREELEELEREKYLESSFHNDYTKRNTTPYRKEGYWEKTFGIFAILVLGGWPVTIGLILIMIGVHTNTDRFIVGSVFIITLIGCALYARLDKD